MNTGKILETGHYPDGWHDVDFAGRAVIPDSQAPAFSRRPNIPAPGTIPMPPDNKPNAPVGEWHEWARMVEGHINITMQMLYELYEFYGQQIQQQKPTAEETPADQQQ